MMFNELYAGYYENPQTKAVHRDYRKTLQHFSFLSDQKLLEKPQLFFTQHSFLANGQI
jgi:hypothetical protein